MTHSPLPRGPDRWRGSPRRLRRASAAAPRGRAYGLPMRGAQLQRDEGRGGAASTLVP